MTQTLGFIGLGAMGLPMASNLVAAGYAVYGYDTHPERMTLAKAAGIQPGESPAAVAGWAGVIFACLPHTEDVEAVTMGTEGFSAGDLRGRVFVDMSTTFPAKTREIAAHLATKGMLMLDAPISGGPAKAEDATLSIMVGGPEGAWERVRPMLEKLGSVVEHMGVESGMGGYAKLCNQIGVYVNLVSVAECMTYAEKFGLPLDKVYKLLANGVAGSMQLDIKAPKVIDRDWSPVGPVWMAHKDVGYVVRSMEESGFSLPFISQVEPLLKTLRERGHENKDQSVIVELFEEMAGIKSGSEDA